MEKWFTTLLDLLKKLFGKDDPTPAPEPDPEPDPNPTPTFTPVLVAGPVDSGVINWTSGVTVATENYVKDLIGGRDKGSSISVVAVRFKNQTTGKTFTYKWGDMWNKSTNVPKPWDWKAGSPHFGSPGQAQNWHQAGHAYCTRRVENQPLADGTYRGYGWFPYECPVGEVVDVEYCFHATENRGTAYITICTVEARADGKHVFQTVYKLSERDTSNSGDTWVPIAQGIVFQK